MRLKSILMLTTFVVLSACGGGGGGSSSSSTPPPVTAVNTVCGPSAPPAPDPTAINVQPVTVAASLAGTNIINAVMTSLTICKPGTGTCTTVPHIQVDTGSTGLRLLHSVIKSLGLSPLTNGATTHPYGECLAFADGNVWGGLGQVDVRFQNGAVASGITIQVIDDDNSQPAAPQALTNVTAGCNTLLEDSAATLGVNGIIGVGQFLQDCGPQCANPGLDQTYFDCPPGAVNGAGTTTCNPTTLATNLQVSNPVGQLLANNNGVILEFPAINSLGAVSVDGNLVFGIDTLANNALISTTKVIAVPDFSTSSTSVAGSFTVNFNGNPGLLGFFDSGSSVYFFADAGIPTCNIGSGASASAYYCPATPVNEVLGVTGSNGVSGELTVSINDAQTLFSDPGAVAFNDLGAPLSNSSLVSAFDIGLPFFFGRTMYTGFENQNVVAPLGGPFFACAVGNLP